MTRPVPSSVQIQTVALRPAVSADLERLFDWRNRPEIISKGSLQRAVTLEEHAAWFKASLDAGETRRLFITEQSGEAIGQVRFDRDAADQNEATISSYVLDPWRGHGYGAQAIQLGCAALFTAWANVERILAHVRDDNPGGRRGFERAGFQAATHTAAPAEHQTLILERSS